MAFVWVGGKRFKDADCVSVGCSNLKIKSCVHHYITHPISASAQSFPQEGGRWGVVGKQDSKERRAWPYKTGANAGLTVLINAKRNRMSSGYTER